MPPRLTEEQWNRVVRLVGSQEVSIDEVWAQLTRSERRDLIVRASEWAAEQRRRHEEQYFGKPQRSARRLLRSLLTDEQRRQLHGTYGFRVRGSAGGMYRLFPSTGLITRVEERRGRWYETERYCWHEDRALMLPPADRAVAHLCMLRYDEDAFLDQANAEAPYRPRRWAA